MSLIPASDPPSYSTIATYTSATTRDNGDVYSVVIASAVEYASASGYSGGVAVHTDAIVLSTIIGTLATSTGTRTLSFPAFSPSVSVQTVTAAAAAPTSSSTSAPQGGLTTGTKAGIGVGGALGALLVFGLAVTTYKLYHRDQARKGASSTDHENSVENSKGFASDRVTPELDSKFLRKPAAELGGPDPIELEGAARHEIGQSKDKPAESAAGVHEMD